MTRDNKITGWSTLLERALRASALLHLHQRRKATEIPYITHPVAVAWILREHMWVDEITLAAALLHDVLEDTTCSVAQLLTEFPASVVDLVRSLSEQKTDASGMHRSWEDRKRDHLAVLREAPVPARAIALADKLHNLETIQFDLSSNQDVWGRFNAPRERILWYHQAMVAACDQGEPELQSLALAVTQAIHTLAAAP